MPTTNLAKLRAAQHRADAKRAGMRTRAWACIVYPESVPEDWIERLKTAHIETLVSPLHDSDLLPTGKPKKAHYHVLALFPNPVPAASAARYFSLIDVTAPPEMIKNARGYARYLIHLDDHDKHRYSEEGVQEIAGANWKAIALDPAEVTDMVLDEIEKWIDESGCVSYVGLCRYARSERPDWKHTIRRNTLHIVGLMKSMVWEEHNGG